jgi:hypothetical protein
MHEVTGLDMKSRVCVCEMIFDSSVSAMYVCACTLVKAIILQFTGYYRWDVQNAVYDVWAHHSACINILSYALLGVFDACSITNQLENNRMFL